jgi:major membrane immunogen (membrane-anchored lipoprotein)
MRHLGLTPQSINMLGGMKVQGQTPEAVEHVKGATFPSDSESYKAQLASLQIAKQAA